MIQEAKVTKWGNSMGIRLSAALVRELGVIAGDEVVLRRTSDKTFELTRKMTKLEALEEVRKMRRPLPEGYKFNREELYERGSIHKQELVGQ